jgi:hypothetical protein
MNLPGNKVDLDYLYSLFMQFKKIIAFYFNNHINIHKYRLHQKSAESSNAANSLHTTNSTERPPLWFSGQSSWLQIRRPEFDSRHYQKKQNKKSSGSGTGCTQPRDYN